MGRMGTHASTAMKSGVAGVAIALIATGCGTGHPQPRTLEGTNWQLVSIQSMDDAQGTTAVPDPTKFTVEFAAGGQAFFQIDCNRGKGSYTAEPSADGVSGSLTFGPIATTLMLCPQPSMDRQVSTALGEVRGYLFSGDELHLSKMADGGILTWKKA